MSIELKYDLETLENLFEDDNINVHTIERKKSNDGHVNVITFDIPEKWFVPDVYADKDNELGVFIISSEVKEGRKICTTVSSAENFTIMIYHVMELCSMNLSHIQRQQLLAEYTDKLKALSLDELKSIKLVPDAVSDAANDATNDATNDAVNDAVNAHFSIPESNVRTEPTSDGDKKKSEPTSEDAGKVESVVEQKSSMSKLA